VMPAGRARVEPGCEVVVPNKIFDPNKMTGVAAVNMSISMVTAIASMALVVVTAISVIK